MVKERRGHLVAAPVSAGGSSSRKAAAVAVSRPVWRTLSQERASVTQQRGSAVASCRGHGDLLHAPTPQSKYERARWVTLAAVDSPATSVAAVLLLAVLLPASLPAGAAAWELVNDWRSLKTVHGSVQTAIVDLHNDLRRNVTPSAGNMLQMMWKKEVYLNALSWANNCTFGHSPDARRKTTQWTCGENIFMSSAPFTWNYAIRDWYNEVTAPGFQYNVGAVTPGAVGHYTQLVWYNSFQLGCAVNYCPNNPGVPKYLYVCHYCPMGNLNTRINRPYDLGTRCASCPKNCVNNLCNNPCKYKNGYANCASMVAQYTCKNAIILKNCAASCNCEGRI
ncbi:uncharacterized protein LOC144948341 [Lampetra fluviatilis]